MQYVIFCGAKSTMESIAAHGAVGLNRETNKWQIISKEAEHEVVSSSGILWELRSNIDLQRVAKEKGLIL